MCFGEFRCQGTSSAPKLQVIETKVVAALPGREDLLKAWYRAPLSVNIGQR